MEIFLGTRVYVVCTLCSGQVQ